MKVFFDETQYRHQPTQYMVHGKFINPYENPNRASTLIEGLQTCGIELAKPGDFGLKPIWAIHPAHYVRFLKTAFARFEKLENRGVELLPSTAPIRNVGRDSVHAEPPRTQSIIGQAGYYIRGASNAIMDGTYEAAYASAQTAIAGAEEIRASAAAAFSLCRPPGHHATNVSAAGFCFFNNAAVAAEVLRQSHDRVAIIDFDTHHGDGTQHIFYERDDVFFGSTHTDPTEYYPHYTGFEDETGRGRGRGANLNLPLAQGSGDKEFIAAVEGLAEAAVRQHCTALVVSAGWDAHHLDPLSKLKVTTDAYRAVGKICGQLGLPTLIVQEGGYSLEAIREAAPAFMQGFTAAHPRL